MRIKELIAGVLADMVTAETLSTYIYATPSRQNVDLSYSTTPVALFTVLTDSDIDLKGGMVRETAQVAVDFVTDMQQPTTDFEADEMESKIDDMAAIAAEFVSTLYHADGWEFVGDTVRVTYLYDFRDRNTTGVRVKFTIKELNGVCL